MPVRKCADDATDEPSNVSDGFHSPGGREDALHFLRRLPALCQVVFVGQSAHSARRAYGRGPAGDEVVAVELEHDADPWEQRTWALWRL